MDLPVGQIKEEGLVPILLDKSNGGIRQLSSDMHVGIESLFGSADIGGEAGVPLAEFK